jgi:hypothetical protein
VDAIITFVAPHDGTGCKDLKDYLQDMPPWFRDITYALKQLENGNWVVDGAAMSYIYKLIAFAKEWPGALLVADFETFEKAAAKNKKFSKTMAAIRCWMKHGLRDLPLNITKLSFDSYDTAVDDDGYLPIKLFECRLNFKHLTKAKIKVQICYASDDDLVTKEASLAPCRFVDGIEVTEYENAGHMSIATTLCHPDSPWALDKVYSNGSRGPILFHQSLKLQLH